jgi:hypothetical protein
MEVMTRCVTTAGITCRLWTRIDLTSWTNVNIFWLALQEKVSSGTTSRLSCLSPYSRLV